MKRVQAGVGRTVEVVTWTLCGALVLLVSANVFARYVLETGWLWAEEASRLIFVWMVFLGAYVALRRRQHMAIDFVAARLPARGRAALATATRLSVLLFLVVLVWSGTGLVRTTLDLGRTTPILGISAAWGYLAVPVAGLLMLLEVVAEAVRGEEPAA